MIIALASPRVASSLDDGLERIDRLVGGRSRRVCSMPRGGCWDGRRRIRSIRLTEWGSAAAPYYEKAMMMRSIENTIYFASVNYAVRFQEAATTLIDPSGRCQAFLPYGEEGVLVQEIDVETATGLLAGRYAPERYREEAPTGANVSITTTGNPPM